MRLIFIICIFLLSACTRRGSDTIEVTLANGEKARLDVADTLRVNLTTEPPTLDWHKATDTTSWGVVNNLMEGLVQLDALSETPRLVPALALTWKPIDGARKWKFTLRRDAVWSDGVPFKEEHLLDGWRRLLDPQIASGNAHFLFGVKNARDFHLGKKKWEDVGVRITAPFELTVELERPMAFFPFLMRAIVTFPVRLDVIEKFGDRWTEPGHLVSLGPFRLKSWMHDKLLALERNETYFGMKPAYRNIVGYMIHEQATALNLFESGRLDSLHDLPSIEIQRLRKRSDYREKNVLRTYFFSFNVNRPPVNQARVRRAIAMAIDRDEIVKMLNGGERPITSWIPPGLVGHDPGVGLKFNPEAAREELRKAGFKDGAFPKFEFKFNTNENHQRIAENLQAQLKKNLGIDIELKNEEWKVYLSSLKTDPPAMFRMGWQCIYLDPDDYMTLMSGSSENNRTLWKNDAYDKLVLEGAGISDPAARAKIYAKAQKIMLEDDVPVIPIYAGVTHQLVHPRVEDYPSNPIEAVIYKGVRLKAK